MRDGYAGDLAVPLWGRFMSAATRGDKPDNFKAPRTVTSATICRITGKLATGECYGAESVDKNGNIIAGRSVYTGASVRGSEPEDYCPFHTHTVSPPNMIFAAVAPQAPRPAAAAAADVSAPIATAAGVGEPPATVAAAPVRRLPRRRSADSGAVSSAAAATTNRTRGPRNPIRHPSPPPASFVPGHFVRLKPDTTIARVASGLSRTDRASSRPA